MSKARATGGAGSDDEYEPPSQGAARGAKKHPVTEAVLRFATEKKGSKAGPFVNKVFEQAIVGAEQEAARIEGDDDDARAAPIANTLCAGLGQICQIHRIRDSQGAISRHQPHPIHGNARARTCASNRPTSGVAITEQQ